MLLAEKQLSRQPIRAFHFIGRRTDRGLTAIYHEGHLKHVVLPAIDRVLRRTGFNAESYTRNDVLMAVLGLDPDTKHVFTAPDALYSGPGVANVLNISSAATGKYKDLPWPEMNLAQNLISAVYECSDYVAYNAQELKFTIALDEESTRDCAVLFFVVDGDSNIREVTSDSGPRNGTNGEAIVVEIQLLADRRVSIRFRPTLKFLQNRFPQFNSDGRSFSRNTFPPKPLRTCGLCAYKEKGMHKCGRCKSTYYCCKAHQTEDWKRHRTDCIGRGGDAGTQDRITMRMTRGFDRLQADRAKFPVRSDFKFRANILNMEWFFEIMRWNRSDQWTYTKVEEGDRVVAKGTVEVYVCTATFSPHPVQDLLLAHVFVGGGFHSFTLELSSYREAVIFLRIFMDLNID